MRFFIIVAIIVILLGLFFVSLDNLAEFGLRSLALAAISSFALFRVFKYVYEGKGTSAEIRGSGSAKVADLMDYMILGEVAKEEESDKIAE